MKALYLGQVVQVAEIRGSVAIVFGSDNFSGVVRLVDLTVLD